MLMRRLNECNRGATRALVPPSFLKKHTTKHEAPRTVGCALVPFAITALAVCISISHNGFYEATFIALTLTNSMLVH